MNRINGVHSPYRQTYGVSYILLYLLRRYVVQSKYRVEVIRIRLISVYLFLRRVKLTCEIFFKICNLHLIIIDCLSQCNIL